MEKIIDGKQIAQQLITDLAKQVTCFSKQYQKAPALAVVLVGDDAASHVYVKNKIKRANEVGIKSNKHSLSANASQAQLLALIKALNTDKNIHGILVQLPLPAHIDEKAIINAIAVEKDVDGFHPMNVGALVAGNAKLIPCTPLGCMKLLNTIYDDLSGKVAVVVGRSNIVGKPIASLLLATNCTVITVHSKTKNIAELCAQADIVIAAVGQAKLIKSTWIKSGATVIDVGINVIAQNDKRQLVGDVDFDDVVNKVKAISPVPGGVGPMTIACLMQNTLVAAQQQENNLQENNL